MSAVAAFARKGAIESKYVDAAKAATAIVNVDAATTWAGCELDNASSDMIGVNPSMGDAYYHRDGRKILTKKIAIKGSIIVPAQANATAADQAGKVRIVMYRDKQTGGVQAQAEDVIGDAGAQAGVPAACAIEQFQNPVNFGKFQVFYDKTFRLPDPTFSYDGTNLEQAGYEIPFKFSKRMNMPVNFNGGSGPYVGSVVDNSLHLIAACTGGLAPSLRYTARTYFVG